MASSSSNRTVVRRQFSPGLAFEIGQELWVLDRRQPAIAVLDADARRLEEVLSWRALSPGRSDAIPMVLRDGDGLWLQTNQHGGLARVTRQGVGQVTWTDGLRLQACRDGVAWCGSRPPRQAFVSRPAARSPMADAELHGGVRLLRVDVNGRLATIRLHAPLRHVQVCDDGLLVQIDLETWHPRDLGADVQEMEYDTRWLLIRPGEQPEYATVESHALPEGFEPPPDPFFESFAHPGLSQAAYAWFLDRERRASPDPRRQRIADLFDEHPLDISDLCWPLVPEPADAASYVAQTVERHQGFDSDYDGDMEHATARATGSWPDTMLELTFAWHTRPGLTLRRRLRLFDEVGRIDSPQFALVHLLEDLDTGAIPPASAAIDGFLDT